MRTAMLDRFHIVLHSDHYCLATHQPASTGTHLFLLHNAQDWMRTAVLDRFHIVLHSDRYCLATHRPASTGTHLSPLRTAQGRMRTAALDRFNTISTTTIQLGHKLTRHLTLVFGWQIDCRVYGFHGRRFFCKITQVV